MSTTTCLLSWLLLSFSTQTHSRRSPRHPTHGEQRTEESDPYAFLRPIELTSSPTLEPTQYPTLHTTATLIDDIFSDDYLCNSDSDTGQGWSNCDLISETYHGPLHALHNQIYRKFQCTEQYLLSSQIRISFSLAFDCNNAFSDFIQLFIDNQLLAHFNPFPIESALTDSDLLHLSHNNECNQWFVRHVSDLSLNIAMAEPFILRFVTVLKSNLENIVIYDISIQCMAPNPSDMHRLYIAINDELHCEKNVKGNGIIHAQNISTIATHRFVAFQIPIANDSVLQMRTTNNGVWTLDFSVTEGVIYFENETYPQTSMDLSQTFWVSWLNGNVQIGMGSVINNVRDTIIMYALPLNESINIEYIAYFGADFVFYDYRNCDLDLPNIGEISNANNNNLWLDSGETYAFAVWNNNNYLMFEVHSNDSACVRVAENETHYFEIIFQSNECKNNMSKTPILFRGNGHQSTAYCTAFANYDLLLDWTFWVYWDHSQILFGEGRSVGNGIIYTLDIMNANNINNIRLSSVAQSQWVLYGQSPTTTTTTTVTPSDNYNISAQSFDGLLCKRYYTHSNSKSQIDTLQTMATNDFVSFSVKTVSETMENTPQMYLSYWNVYTLRNRNSENINNHWWFSVEFDLSKQSIYLKNNSDTSVAQTIFPTQFLIKECESHCFLDITQEMNVFWNCDSNIYNGHVWHYNSKTQRIYNKAMDWYLLFDNSDRNAKVTPYPWHAMAVDITESDDNRYILSFVEQDSSAICQLSKDGTQQVYTTWDGKTLVYGYEAKFKCDSVGIETKFVIPFLSAKQSWTRVWITSFNNDNIRLGIGDTIGDENDIIFSFDYTSELETEESMQYLWIDSYQSSHWIFDDYSDSEHCVTDIIDKYNVSMHTLDRQIKYGLKRMTDKFIPKSVWNNRYLMFNISSFGETWLKFEMKSDDTFIIMYGTDSVKDICDDTRGITNHIIIMKNSEYIYCSKYHSYDTSFGHYLFWVFWTKDNVLRIGNGPDLGQSAIANYDTFNSHIEIESIAIGSNNHDSLWTFYATQIEVTLRNQVFDPSEVLVFTMDYSVNALLFTKRANISIISTQLNINYLFTLDFEQFGNGRSVKIIVPDYKHIEMHKHFDSLYYIHINSTDLLFTKTEFALKRKTFMNLAVYFVSDMSIGDTIKVLKYEILNHKEIVQNSSSIRVVCHSLGINAMLFINYASNQCLLCLNNNTQCMSCYDGIIPNYNSFNANTTDHILYLYSNDTILSITQTGIHLSPCAVGFGNNNKAMQCQSCANNQFNIFQNDNECHLCDTESDIYQCKGAANIWIRYNAWITVSEFDNSIISNVCPPLMCCQNNDGCYYKTEQMLCAENRDNESVLCRQCLKGYSEIYGSTACKVCTNDYYLFYLLIAVFISLLYALCLAIMTHYFDSEIETENNIFSIQKQIEDFNYLQLIINDYIKALVISFLRSVSYFYQSFAYILYNYYYFDDYMYYTSVILQIFSLDLSVHSAYESDGFCFVSGLTLLSKEIWLLFVPFSLLFSLAIIWIFLHSFKDSKYCPNFLSLLWNAFLFCSFMIITRLFKLLSCTQMSENSAFIHFYAPQKQCFGLVWYLALSALVIFAIFWILIWAKLYLMTTNDRQKPSRLWCHKCIVSPYKDRFWYFEFVILFRRAMLAFFVTFKHMNYSYFTFVLLVYLVVCLMFQMKCKPFKYKRINFMECLCLLLLIAYLCLHLLNSVSFLFVIVCIVLPFLLLMTRMYSFLKLFCAMKYSENKGDELDSNQQKKLCKIIQRLPFKQRSLIKSIMGQTMPHIKMAKSADTAQMISDSENEEFLNDTDSNSDSDTDVMYEMNNELTSGNTSNIVMYLYNNNLSPGAVPPHIYNSDKSADKSIEISSITPQTGRSNTHHRAGQSMHNNNVKNQNGEDSQNTILSSTPQSDAIPHAFAFKYNDRNLMEYHTNVINSTQEYSSTVTDVYDTDFISELNVFQNEEKYPLDGPNIIHQNPMSFNHEMNDIISVINDDHNHMKMSNV